MSDALSREEKLGTKAPERIYINLTPQLVVEGVRFGNYYLDGGDIEYVRVFIPPDVQQLAREAAEKVVGHLFVREPTEETLASATSIIESVFTGSDLYRAGMEGALHSMLESVGNLALDNGYSDHHHEGFQIFRSRMASGIRASLALLPAGSGKETDNEQ